MQPIIGKTMKDLPPRHNYKYDWSAVAQRVRKSPGEWVLVFESIPHSVVGVISKGNIRALPRDEFEYATRNNVLNPDVTNGRVCDLLLRYVGTEKEKK